MNPQSDQEKDQPHPRIAVIGLGYVGLPLALAFARRFPHVVGFDVNVERINAFREGIDVTKEGLEPDLKATTVRFSDQAAELGDCNFLVVAVPTPVDENNTPDLSPIERACAVIAPNLRKGAIVVFESTVYPGVTEDICGPLLEQGSGLRCGKDFFLGYSPERINPGDKEHSLEKVIKVVAGQDSNTLEQVAHVYESVVTAGVHRASSIKVAEAAKVIENTQRDLNIALMNELALIFDRLGISTREVLEAAGTKWNFLRFQPGLVGGHCIGVDPYYLTTKAQQVGYHPQVILAGRRINDEMGKFIANKAIKLLATSGLPVRGAKIGILGLTFKENVADVRNSRVPDIAQELSEYAVSLVIHDPFASPDEVHEEYGLSLTALDSFQGLDALILAVSHRSYLDLPKSFYEGAVRKGGVIVDVKGFLKADYLPESVTYWSL